MRGLPNIAAMHLTTLKPDDRDVARNTHRPNKDPSSTRKANHTHEKFITNRHLGMASPFQLREWKPTRNYRVKLNPLPLHADELHPGDGSFIPSRRISPLALLSYIDKIPMRWPQRCSNCALAPGQRCINCQRTNRHMKQLRVCAN